MQSNQYFVSILSDLLNFYSNEYDNKVVLGDFHFEPSSPSMLSSMDSRNFVRLIKNKTCFKGKGSCIDLILTTRTYFFKNTSSCETGLSGHHHLICSVIKTIFNCKKTQKNNFKGTIPKDFQNELLLNIGDGKNNYLEIEKNFVETLNKHAAKKTKILQGIISPTLIKHWEKLL